MKIHHIFKRDDHYTDNPPYYDVDVLSPDEEETLLHPTSPDENDNMFKNDDFEKNTATVVKVEEIFIVLLILVLWALAIALFFNRWGKIRMLEPYQPKFCESHRPSCPIVTTEVTAIPPHFPKTFSKFNLSTAGGSCGNVPVDTGTDGSPQFAKCTSYYHNHHHLLLPSSVSTFQPMGKNNMIFSGTRPRQNSVFVTSASSSSSSAGKGRSDGICGTDPTKLKSGSRRAKSAIDLSTIVLSEQFYETVRRSSKNSVTHL